MGIKRSIILIAFASVFALWFHSCNTTGIPQTYTLTASTDPEDGGAVTPSNGEFDADSVVEITAEPADEYRFVRWEGDIEGDDNPLEVIFDGDKEITAVFTLREYELEILTEGEGHVREEIMEEKSREYEHGTVVELTAEPAENWRFVRWEGDLEGEENPVTITIDEEKSVSAVFARSEYALNIETEGEGTVREEVVQTKTKDYEYGTEVELTADPDNGWRFSHWEGDLQGEGNPETIVVDAEKNVLAVFENMLVSHGYVEGISPNDEERFAERSYPTVRADWEGPGGDRRWLGMNLGATAPPESVDDENADRAGWYFRFNREQGYYHDGSIGNGTGFPTGPSSRSTIREKADWEEGNDPCRKLLGNDWRIPTREEWEAAAASGTSRLNLHAGGRLFPSFGHPLGSRGENGVYWSGTQHNRHNGIAIEINDNGTIERTERILKHHGLPVRCIEA